MLLDLSVTIGVCVYPVAIFAAKVYTLLISYKFLQKFLCDLHEIIAYFSTAKLHTNGGVCLYEQSDSYQNPVYEHVAGCHAEHFIQFYTIVYAVHLDGCCRMERYI